LQGMRLLEMRVTRPAPSPSNRQSSPLLVEREGGFRLSAQGRFQ
jgi:hypothetical protein